MTDIMLGSQSELSRGTHKKRRKYLEEEEREKMQVEDNALRLAMSSPEIRKRSSSQSRIKSGSSKHRLDSEEKVRKSAHVKKEVRTRVTDSKSQEKSRKERPTTPPSDDDHKLVASKDVKKRRKGRSTPPSSDEEIFDTVTPASSRRRAERDDRKFDEEDRSESRRQKVPCEDTLEEEVERLGQLFVDDAGALFKHFERAFGDVTKDLRKPNVLLTGITGAGKSSLINAVFGQKLAKTGTGVPITQHFTQYTADDMGVVIYDSKGLEHGHFKDFIETTNEFFDSHQVSKSGESADAIHVIWYIINSAHSRFEPFEETICRELFHRVPILFILNKADISSPSDRARLREIITDLPNCVGVFDVVATPQSCKIEVDECPKCHSDDIIIKRRQAMMLCEGCGHEQSVKPTDGLESVIAATTKALPTVVRGAFISAQSVSFTLKEQRSHQVILEFWKDYSTVRSSARLVKMIAKMMASLSIVWEFKKHGEKYGNTLAHDLMAGLNWKDKLSLLLRQADDQRLHCCALGVLWNRCLRDLAVVIFCKWAKEGANNKAVDSGSCKCLYETVFEQFNDEDLLKLEDQLDNVGLETILDEEREGSARHLQLEFSGHTTPKEGLSRQSTPKEFHRKVSGIKK